MKNYIKVALINPPVVGHLVRGTGIYTTALCRELEKLNELDIIKCQIGTNLSGYNLVHYPYFDPFFLTLKVQAVLHAEGGDPGLLCRIRPDIRSIKPAADKSSFSARQDCRGIFWWPPKLRSLLQAPSGVDMHRRQFSRHGWGH